jgi:hypothetical protein
MSARVNPDNKYGTDDPKRDLTFGISHVRSLLYHEIVLNPAAAMLLLNDCYTDSGFPSGYHYALASKTSATLNAIFSSHVQIW